MSITKQWIEIALKDVEASILLYKNNLYSQSFYYFQQASEKGGKALWLFGEEFNQEEVRKLYHNQLKAPRKLISSSIENLGYFEQLEKKFLF